ncbi:MAG: glycosyltransferase family 39 protein [Pirellulales bacterium]|nr:glycosyltransferase family 39 protein [Pirellulales bacterium]
MKNPDSSRAPSLDMPPGNGDAATPAAAHPSTGFHWTERAYRRAVDEAQLKVVLLVALVLASLVPFLNKAVHMDDPLFIYSAQQILRQPTNFYGFDINWYGFVQPMHEVNQNPPLAAYYLALVGLVGGFDEWVMHAGFLAPALGAVLGTYALAWYFCGRPTIAAAIALAMPVTLVSSTTLMCDTLLLCFWCWAVALWLGGERRGRSWSFVLAGLCIAAAALTKYFGICLVPLLFVYSVACRTPLGRQDRDAHGRDWRCAVAQVVGLALPCLALAAFEWWTRRLYGHGLVSDANLYADAARQFADVAWSRQFLLGATCLGGCVLSVLFYVPLMWGRWGSLAAVVVFAALAGVVHWHGSYLDFTPPAERGWTWLTPLQASAFLSASLAVVLLGLVDLARRRDAESLLLALWAGGTFVFATFFNWTVTARTILPVVPAVAIWIVRALDRPLTTGSFFQSRFALIAPFALSLALSIAVAVGDQSRANSARVASGRIPEYLFENYQADAADLWFQGHWGFQYYLERLGARAVDFTNGELVRDEFVLAPVFGSNVRMLPTEDAALEPPMTVRVAQGVTTISSEAGACFYNCRSGAPFPYAFGPNSVEYYIVFHVRNTIPLRQPKPGMLPGRSPGPASDGTE